MQLHLLYETAPRITDLSSIRRPKHLSSGPHSGRFTMCQLFSGALRCLIPLHFLLSTPLHPGLHLKLVYLSPMCRRSSIQRSLPLYKIHVVRAPKWHLRPHCFITSNQHFLFTSLGHHNPLTRGGCCVPRRAISPYFLQIPV